MRNDYIGTSIDGDARAACGCRHSSSNTCAGNCVSRQSRTCGCGNCGAQTTRDCDCNNRSAYDGCCDSNRQGRSNDCEKCDNHSRQSCHDGCNEYRNDFAHKCSNGCTCHDRTPAMVYAQHHDLDSIYGCERALIRGTLFGCLDKPMCHERCTENPCITQCQADKFTIWELRLYLNTHPCDQKALALLRKLTQQMDDDCGCTFNSDCNRWSWTDGPWPWEYQRCCGKEA